MDNSIKEKEASLEKVLLNLNLKFPLKFSLEDLILQFPNASGLDSIRGQWDWYSLSANPNISIDFVDKNLDKPWNWESLSRNPNVTIDFVNRHLDKPWNPVYLLINPSIDISQVTNHTLLAKDKAVFWYYASGNSSLKLSFIEQNLDKPWNWGLKRAPSGDWVSTSSSTIDICTTPVRHTSKEIVRYTIPIFEMLNISNKNNIWSFSDRMKYTLTFNCIRVTAFFNGIASKITFIPHNLRDPDDPDPDCPDAVYGDIDGIPVRIFYDEEDKFNRYIRTVNSKDDEALKYIIKKVEGKGIYMIPGNIVTSPLVIDKQYKNRNLSDNPNITMKFIKDHIDKDSSEGESYGRWDWKKLSKNIAITDLDLSLNWDYEALSANPNITVDFIEKNIDEDWDWYYLSKNPNITIDFVVKHPANSWDWFELSANPNTTMDDILKYPRKPWNWNGLSYNPNLTIDIIKQYPDKEWNWHVLSANPNIPIEVVLDYSNKPWNYQQLSYNTALYPCDIANNPIIRWDYYNISNNRFVKYNKFMAEKNTTSTN